MDDTKLARQAWPNGGCGTILLTSRDHTAGHNPASESLQIEPFNTESGATAFLSLTDRIQLDRQSDRSCAMEITALLGGLPLALEQMSSYVVRMNLSLEKFLPFYKRHKAKLDATCSEYSTYPHSLATVFDISLGSLTGNAASLQNLLAFLHPDSIEDELLYGPASFVESRPDLTEISWLADEIE